MLIHRNGRSKKKLAVCAAVFLTALILSGIYAVSGYAANTLFDQPDFTDTTIQPQTRVYMNGTNIIIDNMPYGLIADMDNVNGIGAGIAEINAQISGISAGRDSIAIYTNGADMTAADVNAAASAGWPRAEVYYYDYFVSVYLQASSEDFAPRIGVLSESPAQELLSQAGYAEQVGLVSVDGVTLPFFGAILYAPDFSFLSGKSLYAYKYMPSVARFVQVGEPDYNAYEAGFLGLNALDAADGDANGTYVITTSPLPEEITASASEWQELPTVSQEEELVITDPVSNTTWTFTGLTESNDFDPEASVSLLSETEVSVDFAFSGELPGSCTVEITLPAGFDSDEGTTLLLYYRNEESGNFEFVTEGTLSEGKVIFELTHCSAYIITPEDRGESYPIEDVAEITEAESEESTEEAETESTADSEVPDTETSEQTVDSTEKADHEPGAATWILIAVLCAAAAGGVCAIVLILRKKRK